MKRLFEVNGEFFDNKKAAKVARGEPTKPAAVETVKTEFGNKEVKIPAVFKHPITLGPDHWKFNAEGVQRAARIRRRNKA